MKVNSYAIYNYVADHNSQKMWPVLMAVARTYAPYAAFPVAVVVGFVGYNFENLMGRAETPWKEDSIQEERLNRKLDRMVNPSVTDVPTLKSKKDMPKTVLNRNDITKLSETHDR